MSSTEKVSIVIPLYNRFTLVGETLYSVIQQTYSDWEAIVVDDGSTDGSFEKVEKIASTDARIKLHKRSRLPKGASACRNIGAELATGAYLIFLDSDDLLAPFCLERRLKYYKKYPDKNFLVFPMLLFNKEPYDLKILWNIETNEDDLKRFLGMDAVWQTTCPIYKKSFFMQTKGFNEALPYRQDYELHLRLLISETKYKKLLNVAPDCFLRRHESASISQSDFYSSSKLYVKEKVFYDALTAIQHSSSSKKREYSLICGAMLFKTSLEWIKYQGDLKAALRYWKKYGQSGIINGFEYKFSELYLKMYHYKLSEDNILIKAIRKAYYFMLPKHLKLPKKTLGQISWQSATKIN